MLWSLQLSITLNFTHQVNFFLIFLVWNCFCLVMNDLDTSLIYWAETASGRCGLVQWSYSSPISLFSDIHIFVLVSQSWKKNLVTFLLTFCGRSIRKRARFTPWCALIEKNTRYNNFWPWSFKPITDIIGDIIEFFL